MMVGCNSKANWCVICGCSECQPHPIRAFKGDNRGMSQEEEIEVLVNALVGMVNVYTALVNCGDCGNWNPEEDKEVIVARKAFALLHRT